MVLAKTLGKLSVCAYPGHLVEEVKQARKQSNKTETMKIKAKGGGNVANKKGGTENIEMKREQ